MSILDECITDLLHIDDAAGNRLIDLRGDGRGTYYLSRPGETDLLSYMLSLIKSRTGKPGNTMLKGSSMRGEQMIGRGVNSIEWSDANGYRDPAALGAFADALYRDIGLKGNNPLFLGLGALEWRVSAGKDEFRDVLTPLVIFPALLVRGGAGSPISLEFPDDEVYLNPCLFAKLRAMKYNDVADGFPLPASLADADDPIDISRLDPAYFLTVEKYITECRGSDESVFRFVSGVAALARYDHGDVCMYRDIRANRERLETNDNVRRIFFRDGMAAEPRTPDRDLRLPLARDSVQEELIGRIAAGESLIVKGPPGSGKTQTISNLISALMGKGRSVLLSSKKLSALGEVYAKLPDKLRPFAMLLESETEAQAANMRPEAVTAKLKALVRARRNYRMPGEDVYGARRRALGAMSTASRFIEDYRRTMFAEGTVAGRSYYKALDVLCRGEGLPALPFIPPEEARGISAEEYERACENVAESAGLLDSLTDNGRHEAAYCPYIGMRDDADAESVRAALAELAGRAKELLSVTEGAGADDFSLSDIAAISRRCLSEDEIAAACACGADAIGRISEAYAGMPASPSCEFAPFDGMESALERLEKAVSLAEGLTLRELKSVADNAALFEGMDRALLSNVEGVLDETDALIADAKVHYYNAAAVFGRKEDLTEEKIKSILSSREALSKYENGGRTKPGLMDFAARRAIKTLAPLCIGGPVGLPALAAAVKEFCTADGEERTAEGLRGRLASIMHMRLTEEQERCVSVMAHKTSGEPSAFVAALPGVLAAAEGCSAAFSGTDMTPRELAERFSDGMKRAILVRELEAAGFGGEPRSTAAAVLAAAKAGEAGRPAAVRLSSPDIAEKTALLASALADGLAAFGDKYYRNALTERARLRDLHALIREWNDRSVADAALRFGRLTDGAAHVREFFALALDRGVRAEDMPDVFEHSFFAAAVGGVADGLGSVRNGMGHAVADALERYAEAEREAAEADISLIEARCMSAVDPEAREFAFLEAERGGARNLRRLFKDRAEALVRLERCFILSPSSVSLLMRQDEYFDFDVAIVDEASQLEPAAILPVIMRCRSIVIVGDEWQMPPMRDFRASPDAEAMLGDGEIMGAADSALSLALGSEAFSVKELVCHYRSKTESLIAFSRRRFYPYMRTFPAAVPMVRGELGFTDIYVPDGVCEKGVNDAEARAIVGCLRRHFEKYYDAKTGKLSRSFGVVAFGEPQTAYIRALVAADKELSDKMERALANFGDVPEKLMFFKTIRTVQGQETEHLFLSLTYGRRANGSLWQQFGTLNRGNLGECVFNVAVTRAMYSVTVVHSVKGHELTESSVAYIGEYLRMAEKFAAGERGGFAGSDPGPGFFRSVGGYIRSLGISEDRIVYDYGVTDGSVRVPVAVLSPDKSRAVLGVWCERDVAGSGYDYYDCEMRYYESLAQRGWTLHRISAHDWTDNAEAERRALAEAVMSACGITR